MYYTCVMCLGKMLIEGHLGYVKHTTINGDQFASIKMVLAVRSWGHLLYIRPKTILRIWADRNLLHDSKDENLTLNFTRSVKKKIHFINLENFPLKEYDNHIPNFEFEVLINDEAK